MFKLGVLTQKRVERHSGFILPTIGIGVVHSDDFYGDLRYKLYGSMVPVDKLFHTIQWLDEYILNPKFEYYVNGPSDATINQEKYIKTLDVEYMTDILLYQRVGDASQSTTPQKLIDFLTINSLDYYTNISHQVSFYTDREITQIIQRVDDELIMIGNGDWNNGAAIVKKYGGAPLIIDLASSEISYQLRKFNTPIANDQPLKWFSSDDSVVSVSQDGLVRGNKKGSTTIVAYTADKIKIDPPIYVIVTYFAKKIQIQGNTTVASGKTIELYANVFPSETTNKKSDLGKFGSRYCNRFIKWYCDSKDSVSS